MTILSYLQRLQQSANPKSVLDIGANVGDFSRLCRSLWNDIDILMVEGNENCEPDLKLTGYPYTIELLGDEEKEVDFYIQSDNIKGTGCSYYREVTHLYDEPIIVKKTLKKLDDIVNQTFDIIKIDTQGSELDIIRGGKNTISKASYVILELPIKEYNLNSPKIEDIIEEMKSLGFDGFNPIEEHRWPNHDNLFKYNELFQIDAVFTKKSMKKTNIIDCFPYFNEKELLELRINLLNDYVDYFVIMEGDRTHSGAPKEFTCMKDLEVLGVNTDKVVVLQVELPEGEDIHNQIDVKNIIKNELEKGVEEDKKYLSHWARERIQRDALLNLVDDCDDNTVFFITDCDEIVDPKNIEYIAKVVRDNPEVVIKIPLVFLEGSANCRVYYNNGNPVEWNISTFACLKSHLKKATPTELRCNISDYELRGITENGKYVPDLGWHFGWMGDIERRRTKCQSFLHANTFNTEENVNNITSYIPQEGSPSVSDYKNFILKKYPNSLLPQKIFELPRVKAFLISDETEEFDWGNNPQEMPGIIGPEIFLNRIYEKIVEIEEGDIVVDIGANVGAFGYSIKDRNVKMIYCVEPSNGLVDTLAKNLQGMPAIIINRAISNDTDDNKKLIGPHNIYGNIGDTYKTITFKKLIEDYNISHIDFLKIDCEGGEYEVFTEENRDYILNNVKNVAGEWHFLNEGTVELFKKFRDLYLKGYEYKVFDRYNNDVSEEILDNQYLIHYERFHRETLTAQFMVYISYDAPVLNDTPVFTFHSNSRPALWVVDNFYDDPYAVREFALQQEYLQGGLGKGFIGKRSCEQFLFPGLRETFQKITGIPITRWEEHGMNGRFQSTIAGEPNVYHSDEQTWAGAIYLTPDAPYNAGTSLIAHKPTRIRHSSHPEAYKMWSDPNTYDIHLDPSPWERIDVAANVFNRLVIWNAHCPHAAGEYFGETLDTSRLIHLFFFD